MPGLARSNEIQRQWFGLEELSSKGVERATCAQKWETLEKEHKERRCKELP